MGIPRAMQITESEVIQQFGTNLLGSLGRVRGREALILRDSVKAHFHLYRGTELKMPFCLFSFHVIFEAIPFGCRESYL